MENFWKYVNKNGPIPNHMKELGNCWIWAGAKDKDGYGVVASPIINGKRGWNKRAHRVSAYLHNIKDFDILNPEQLILHACDNPSCVNPTHLALGTTGRNVEDRCTKGRNAILQGEQHGYAKLTDEQVMAIRKKYIPRVYTQDKLAKEYGVCRAMISLIVNKRNWKHL
jgi:hypothetical protein